MHRISIAAIIAVAACLTLTACANTAGGVVRDVKNTGKAIDRAAR